MQTIGLRTVIFPSPDLAAATAWWSGLLGEGPYFDEPFYVGFHVGDHELGLVPDAPVEDGAHVYLGVESVPDAVDEAVSHGATVHSPPSDVGGGIITALVRTPQGALVGFISGDLAAQ